MIVLGQVTGPIYCFVASRKTKDLKETKGTGSVYAVQDERPCI
jgi:hypothetical protein